MLRDRLTDSPWWPRHYLLLEGTKDKSIRQPSIFGHVINDRKLLFVFNFQILPDIFYLTYEFYNLSLSEFPVGERCLYRLHQNWSTGCKKRQYDALDTGSRGLRTEAHDCNVVYDALVKTANILNTSTKLITMSTLIAILHDILCAVQSSLICNEQKDQRDCTLIPPKYISMRNIEYFIKAQMSRCQFAIVGRRITI